MTHSVTISILTYKRHQHLRRTLASVLCYADQVAETIVVDNAAEPELRSLLAAEFPQVRYIAAPSNGGCEGRNIGLRAAQTPIVITLDDDVEMFSSNCVNEVEAAFLRDPRLACLNFVVPGVYGKNPWNAIGAIRGLFRMPPRSLRQILFLRARARHQPREGLVGGWLPG